MSPGSIGSNKKGIWQSQNDNEGDEVIPEAVMAQGITSSGWRANILKFLSRVERLGGALPTSSKGEGS